MSKLTLNLPLRYRIDLKMVKRRDLSGVEEKTFIPRIHDLKSWRNGNKVSRFFRHMFEHKKWNRVLGSHLAIAAIASTMLPNVMPAYSSSFVNGTGTVNLSTAPITIKTERGIQFPLSNMHINQGYFSYHPALDLKASVGDDVKSIMVGTVVEASHSRFGYGNAVLISHGGGIETLYAHLSKILVKTGDNVDLDTIIGKAGTTGRSTGPHLHLEVRENGSPVNPRRVLPQF